MQAYDPPNEPPGSRAPPVPLDDRDRITEFLQGKVAAGASARQVADAVAEALQGIDEELTPVIGQRGVAALYKRALHLATQAHPWLPVAQEGIRAAMDLGALTTGLAQRESPDAAAAGAALLQTFHELLARLIGASLTERLLRPVWATFLSGGSAGDTKR